MAVRPPNTRDVLTVINGSPRFLGVLVSTGAVVNNATTATPFYYQPKNAAVPTVGQLANLENTLAGKALLVQATVAGVILTGQAAEDLTVTAQTGAKPGVLLAASERVLLLMSPGDGWLQWLPSVSGNMVVWELV